MSRKGRPSVKVALDSAARKELERVYGEATCAKDWQKA